MLTGTVAAATALVATSAPKPRLGYALGMVQTAVFAGAAAGPLFGGFAYDRIGPRATFVLAGAMLFCGGVIVAFLARERFTRVATHAMTDEGHGRWRRFRTSSAFLFTAAMLTMLGAIFVVRMIAMAMQPIIPLFVQQLTPDDPHVATVAGIVLGLCRVHQRVRRGLSGPAGRPHRPPPRAGDQPPGGGSGLPADGDRA